MIERQTDGTLVETSTGEIVPLLTEPEARDLTARIVTQADALWNLLWESYHREAWRPLGYDSWRAYASTEFGMSDSKAYRLLHHAGIVKELEAAGELPDGGVTENQSRSMRKGSAADDLRSAREATGKDSPSGEDIREHRDDPKPPKLPKLPPNRSPVGESVEVDGEDLPRLALALERLVGLIIDAWDGSEQTPQVSVKRSARRLADHLNKHGSAAAAKPTPKAKREAKPVPKQPAKRRR